MTIASHGHVPNWKSVPSLTPAPRCPVGTSHVSPTVASRFVPHMSLACNLDRVVVRLSREQGAAGEHVPFTSR